MPGTSNGRSAGSLAAVPTSGRRVRAAVAGRSLALITSILLSLVLTGCGSPTPANSPSAAAVSSAETMSPSGASAPAQSPSAPSAMPSQGTPVPAPVPLSAGAQDLQDQFVAVVAKVGPSIVEIETSVGLGSGIIYDDQGDIVTNAHVAAGATQFMVTLADGRRFTGTLVGAFQPDDVAVIHIQATGLQRAVFANSSKTDVGDIVLALGNPLGLQSSVTQGIVSAVGHTVSEPNGNALPDVIQTSAPINPGNSGGALVNLAGAVVGIPTLAASDPQLGGAAAGIGFAIAGNRVVFLADQLIKSGKVIKSGRAYLGVSTADLLAGGLLVRKAASGGPAAQAGVKAGDVITAVNGQSTPDGATLSAILADLQPGGTVTVSIVRANGTRAQVTVVLGEYPG